MANVRLNIFESFPLDFAATGIVGMGAQGTIEFDNYYIPGSISFNKIAVLFNGIQAAGSTRSLTISFGLYSLNGSTLSLANSASQSILLSDTNGLSWLTLVTSATQDVTPGNWYLAMGSTRTGGAGGAGYGFVAASDSSPFAFSNSFYGGPFFEGYHTSAFTAMPASVATSDLVKDSGIGFNRTPRYILISA